MKKKLLLSTVMLFIAFCASAQRTATLFQKTYKITGADTTSSVSFADVARTSDGGYAFLGNYQTSKNQGDMCVIRTDSLGSVLWSVNFNTDTIEDAKSIRPTPDGGFVLCGSNSLLTNSSFGDMLLAKIDANGNFKWATQFGSTEYDQARGVAVLNNGNIIVAGESPEPVTGLQSAYYILTQPNGTPENGQYIRFGSSSAKFFSIDRTLDGGAIAGGYTTDFRNATGFDPILVKFNAQGNVVWGRRYATLGTQLQIIARQTCDLGYLMMGLHSVTQPDGSIPVRSLVIKTNALGDTLWCKAYELELGRFHRMYSAVEVSDGYVISGYMKPGYQDSVPWKTPQGRDTILIRDHEAAFSMKIDQSGIFQWAKYYGDSTRSSYAYNGVATADGGMTLVGQTFGHGNRYGAGYVIHNDKDGNLGTGALCQGRNLLFTTTTFKIRDSTNVIVVEGGEEQTSSLRRETITVVKSDICSSTGLRTTVAACLKIGVADYHLPENAVKIYPNPVSSQLFVEIEKNTEGPHSVANLTIFDAMGRLIQAQQTVNDGVSLDVSTFAKGIYMLKVERGGKYLVKKFIVE